MASAEFTPPVGWVALPKLLSGNSSTIETLALHEEAIETSRLIVVIPGMLQAFQSFLTSYNVRGADEVSPVEALLSGVAGSGAKVVFANLRGRGRSSSDNDDFSVDAQRSDVECVLQHYQQDSIPTTLVGASVGSGHSFHALASGSVSVDRMIALDYPPIIAPLDEEWLERAKSRQPIPHLPDDLPEKLVRDLTIVDMRESLASLNAEIHVLYGDECILNRHNDRVFSNAPNFQGMTHIDITSHEGLLLSPRTWATVAKIAVS